MAATIEMPIRLQSLSSKLQTPNEAQDQADAVQNPLERTWRGSRDGNLRLQGGYPSYVYGADENSLLKKRQWIREHLALSFRYWGKCGFGEGLSGHITVRDPILRDHFWMNPFGVHFRGMRVSDLVLVTPDGYVHPLLGNQHPINNAGFNIHSAIHHARPDVEAAGHCHSLYGKTWSVFGRPVDVTTQDSCLFYNNQAVYENFGGIVLAAQEGVNIAKALGPKNNTVDECAYLFAALDRQCHAQLMIEAASKPCLEKSVIDDKDAEFTANTIQYPENVYYNLQPELELIRRQEPDYLW